MRILFTARYYFPAEGGLQMSTHQLGHRLLERGHDIAVLTAMHAPRSPRMLAVRAFRKLTRIPVVLNDGTLGYPIYRAVDGAEGMRAARRRFRPDVLVMNVAGKTAIRFNKQVMSASGPLPVVHYLRDEGFVDLYAELAKRPDLVIANARKLVTLAGQVGVDNVALIPSVIEVDAYATDTTRRAALLINPVPTRGVDIALALAERRPDIPFVFQQSWPLVDDEVRALQARARELGNVEFRRTEHDPARIYRDAKVLLAPYLVGNRPRVIHEAQANGIPVIATRAGGLIEATGPGGLLVPPDAPLAAWVDALATLWDDDEVYRKYADAARSHSQRAEMDPARLAARFEQVVSSVVTAGPTT